LGIGVCPDRLMDEEREQVNCAASVVALAFMAVSQASCAKIRPITAAECDAMYAKNVIGASSPVGCNKLAHVEFRYVDFNGKQQVGDLVVLHAVARRVSMLFGELYSVRFPINKAVTLENYGGDDDASMNDNNTSSFNSRPIVGGKEWSLHAYGVAIDINPLQNPFVSFDDDVAAAQIAPASAAKVSMNRLNYRPGKDFRRGMAEEVIDIFARNGFYVWGGYWNFPIDYQHFEVGNRLFVEELVHASPAAAEAAFERHVSEYLQCLNQVVRTRGPEAARASCVARLTK
jgi:hypothetical protein